MRKLSFGTAVGILAAVIFTISAFAGSWVQDGNRPANQNGLTNWMWTNDDGSHPKSCWAWIDGNGDGIAESYYFDADGFMMAAPAMPENYTVNADGAWTKNGVVQAFPNEWVPGGNVLTANRGTAGVRNDQLNPISNGISYENATHSTMSDAQAYDMLMELQNHFPDGMAWGDDQLYVSGNRHGYGCAAFIFIVQDTLYGAPARPMTDTTFDMNELRVGDHLRVRNNKHSVIVLTKGDGYITVAEANYNNSVHWGRVIKEDQLRAEFAYRETCY